jgi:hypothetical protein
MLRGKYVFKTLYLFNLKHAKFTFFLRSFCVDATRPDGGEWVKVETDTRETFRQPPTSARLVQTIVLGFSALSAGVASSAGKVYEIAANVLLVPAETSLVQDLEKFSFDDQDTEQYKNQLKTLKAHVSSSLGDVTKLCYLNQFVRFLGGSLEAAEQNLGEDKYARLSNQRQEIAASLFTYVESLKGADIEKRIECVRLIRKVIEPF